MTTFLVKVFNASVTPPVLIKEFGPALEAVAMSDDSVSFVRWTDGEYQEHACQLEVTQMVQVWPITPSGDGTGEP